MLAPVWADDFSAWTRRDTLYLNTTPAGANVAGTVLQFPILVRLDASLFTFSEAKALGADLRFSKPDGTTLPHQVERWDAAAGVAEIWVKADTVKGNSSSQAILMYWGNPAATDASSGAAVFPSSAGHAAVWHLGGFGTRFNAVAGGNGAEPMAYDGDEPRPGIIGLCDSLDGGNPGDHLDLLDGYSGFAGGFTYEVWTYPTGASRYGKLLDLGNGPASDNITLMRVETSSDLAFKIWNGADSSRRVTAKGALALNEWQHFAVTVSGSDIRIYRNGSLIHQDSLTRRISAASRNENFLGKSNWSSNEYFVGKLDEPRLATSARSSDWIRLSFENQRAGQSLVSHSAPGPGCQAGFGAPGDTVLPEGSSLVLAGKAECATGYWWSAVSGPAPRILDPESRSLQLFLPRIKSNAKIIYRFSARFGESVRTKDVSVSILETIPDPVFTMPSTPYWNGLESIVIRPEITNLKAMKDSRGPEVRWDWRMAGLEADTVCLGDGLELRNPSGSGTLSLDLCLDNGGDPLCRALSIAVNMTTGTLSRQVGAKALRARVSMRDAAGRLRTEARSSFAGFNIP